MGCQSDSLGPDRTGWLIVGALDTWAHGSPGVGDCKPASRAPCVMKISNKEKPLCEEARRLYIRGESSPNLQWLNMTKPPKPPGTRGSRVGSRGGYL